jgi:type IV pilus assembly protein PilA
MKNKLNYTSAAPGPSAAKGFSLVELMIVVAILGILAAIVLPDLTGHTKKAKEAAAKENLQLLREAIERYAIKHNDVPPGYPNDNRSAIPMGILFYRQVVQQNHYLTKLPVNPFNKKETITAIANSQSFPQQATGSSGWLYQPSTKTIKLDWPGTDSAGISYFDY